MNKLDLDNILDINKLEDEFEFERATTIMGKLRWMAKDNSALETQRLHLIRLIKEYEEKNWSNEEDITDDRLKESELAEKIIEAENRFIQNRKRLIKRKLIESSLTQKELGLLLGHRPNYMSELMNGARPFSRDDIVILHRIFGIEFKFLIPPFLKKEISQHIKTTLIQLKNKTIDLQIRDVEI